MKKYFVVISTFDDRGRVTASIRFLRSIWICQVKCVNFFIFYRRSDLDRRFDVISLIGIIIGKASHILPHRAVGVLVNQNKSHQFEENTDSSSHAVRSLFLLLTSHQTNPVILSRLAKH